MATEVADLVEAPVRSDFGEVDFDRVRRHVLNRQGKDFIQYPGLVELLHQVSEGYFAIETQLVQVPNRDNGMVAICSARVLVYDRHDPDVVRRCATGLGDADPENVGRGMAPHLIRLAETRAKARAIRDVVNSAMVAADELGPDDQPDTPPVAPSRPYSAQSGASPRPVAPRPAEPVTVDGKTFSAAQVDAVLAARLEEAARLDVALPGPPPAPSAPTAEKMDYARELRRLLVPHAGK